ncbi:MAG: type I phosphomannose isomerase catalytic subunit [Faecalibacterium sp.]
MKQLPILLDQPRAWRSYLGGALLDELHGAPKGSGMVGHFPEEWIISTTQAANPGREALQEGLSHLVPEDENAAPITLKSQIEANPAAWLGAAHVAQFGAQTGVLVKLIDSAERLTIQVHPDRQKARALFQSDYGKTECWHILATRAIDGQTPCVYFGFKEGITRARWEALFHAQDIPAMLDCLHCCPVQVGDTIFIEGGVPHAIGAGCLLVEIQEPTDYTLRTERTTPSGFAVADALCHQGLGFEAMFDCFDYTGYSEAAVREKWFLPSQVLRSISVQENALNHDKIVPPNIERLLIGGDTAAAFFSMKEYLIQDTLYFKGSDAFSGLYVLEGEGYYCSAAGEVTLCAPSQYFLPAQSGDFTLTCTGDAPLRVLQFWGPAAQG